MSYPKVGNTWLKFILAQYYYNEGPFNFKTIEEVIPEIGRVPVSANTIFYKTHLPNNLFFNKSRKILLTRDPTDTLVSYYNFETQKIKSKASKMSFGKFVRSNEFGVPRMNKYYNSFESANVKRFSYEDLLTDTYDVMVDLIKYFDTNHSISSDRLHDAILNSSLKKMKEIEQKSGLSKPNVITKNFSFVGQQNKLSKEELLTEEIEAYINSKISFNDKI